jgi:hypothetical protein
MTNFLITMWGTIFAFTLWSIEKKLETIIQLLSK